RYSTLNQVATSNVGDLALAWIYQTGIAESFQSTPVVAGNVMFLTTPESHVVALNAASGDRLWEFIPRLRRTALCCGPNNRGVAAYGDRVYVGTIDAHLVALDSRTGRVDWDVALADSAEPASITMAPLAAGNHIMVGMAGGEFGIRGRVLALDPATGAIQWRFNTIPGPGEEGQASGWYGQWRETDPFGTPLNRDVDAEKKQYYQGTGESWHHGGGGVYTTPAYDPQTATLFLSVGNPAPDLNGLMRPGDNLFTGSVVALDAGTGRLKWYFQEVPHDLWNLSPASAPVLFDIKGHAYLAQAGKTGWLYVIDPVSGRPLLRSDNFVPQENLFAVPSDTGVRMLPGPNGGAGWAPPAFSPRTGLVYVQAVHQPTVYQRSSAPYETGQLFVGGTLRYLPNEPQWGVVTAIDPISGQIRWQRQLPRPNLSGLLATAGDLVFAGEADGFLDAFDARSGDLVWQYPTGAGVSGGVMTYNVDGVQYVAVASGGDAQLATRPGDNLYVFALRSKIPVHGHGTLPEPRYTRNGPVGARQATPAAQAAPAPATTTPATTTPAAPQPGAPRPTAPRPLPPTATPAAPTTTTAVPPATEPPPTTTTGGAAAPPPSAPRHQARQRGPHILGRPIPTPRRR
ncbi:MAG TPA: PQQ-binding-like beta-propeller repeat protein, partial [Longimicrobiales bacterium]